MKKILMVFAAMGISFAVWAGDGESVEDDVRATVEAFNEAYATNDVAAYFNFYADDATVFFFGERVDMAAYEKDWYALMEAGGGVEVNTMSDLVIQIMPGDEVAITTYFVHNTTRSAEGEVETINAFETDVWRKTDGEWKIVSLHYTVNQ